MSKILVGLILGAVLGLIDGASSYLYGYEEVQQQIVSIIIGSTFKGILTGVAAGWYVRRTASLSKGIALGLAVGPVLSLAVAAMPGEGGQHYWLEITLPGAALGAIVGFATQRYGAVART
jgi:hypothetical protein